MSRWEWQFQSAPAITGGRSSSIDTEFCLCVVSIRARHHWRAIPDAAHVQAQPGRVSIRARHHWRAIRRRVRAFRWVHLFQSAPAITGGRSGHGRLFGLAPDEVSIRARHHWRAIPGTSWIGPSAPSFQSAPAITGGRSAKGCRNCTLYGRFNPRPPSLAGDPSPFLKIRSPSAFQSAPAITGGRSTL